MSVDPQNPNLTEEQKDVLFNKATEAPYTGAFLNHTEQGMYTCANCGAQLFASNTKFDSHCGWPSFYDAEPKAVTFHDDSSHGMQRTEVTCTNCGGHLGHIFPDAPDQPTGQRYCINSASLGFMQKKP